MIGFGVELSPGIGGRGCIPRCGMFSRHLQKGLVYLLNSNVILNQPFVDSFSWVGHEHAPFEIRLCEHVR